MVLKRTTWNGPHKLKSNTFFVDVLLTHYFTISKMVRNLHFHILTDSNQRKTRTSINHHGKNPAMSY